MKSSAQFSIVDRIRGERDYWHERALRAEQARNHVRTQLDASRAEIARLESVTELAGWQGWKS